MASRWKNIVESLGPKRLISELAKYLDEIYEDSVLLRFSELHEDLSSEQASALSGLLSFKPADVGQNMPFYGIEEPSPDIEFKILEDDVRDPDTGEMVSKTRAVPLQIYSAFLKMSRAANDDGTGQLHITSGYRSPARQALLIFYYLDLFEFDAERVFSRVALPGYSEHGLVSETALDIDYTLEHPKDYDDLLFAKRQEYAWLLGNAGGFGFALSYPENNSYGLAFEPWHWRYLGEKAANTT